MAAKVNACRLVWSSRGQNNDDVVGEAGKEGMVKVFFSFLGHVIGLSSCLHVLPAVATRRT